MALFFLMLYLASMLILGVSFYFDMCEKLNAGIDIKLRYLRDVLLVLVPVLNTIIVIVVIGMWIDSHSDKVIFKSKKKDDFLRERLNEVHPE